VEELDEICRENNLDFFKCVIKLPSKALKPKQTALSKAIKNYSYYEKNWALNNSILIQKSEENIIKDDIMKRLASTSRHFPFLDPEDNADKEVYKESLVEDDTVRDRGKSNQTNDKTFLYPAENELSFRKMSTLNMQEHQNSQ